MRHGFIIDLFGTVNNDHWDLARILSGLAFLTVILLALYRIHTGQVPTLSEYADAILKLFAGCAAFIGGKDAARAYATKGAGAS